MHNLLVLSISVFFLLLVKCDSQSLRPFEIIENSIQYHDPENKLLNNEVTLFLTETRPNGSDRKSTISFHLKKKHFQLIKEVDNQKISSTYTKGKTSFSVNGNDQFSKELKEKYRLDDHRLKMLRNYYQYLWLLPLKLLDAGTNFHLLVKTVDFFGKESLEIKVTYDPKVGNDIWYFYFHPKTFALQGYRFYHDEEKNDGEYILLEGETTYKNVRLPKERNWYTHKSDKFLGADILEKISFE